MSIDFIFFITLLFTTPSAVVLSVALVWVVVCVIGIQGCVGPGWLLWKVDGLFFCVLRWIRLLCGKGS